MKRDSVWGKYNGVDIENLEKLNKRYIDFLSQCKTERRMCCKVSGNGKGKGIQIH